MADESASAAERDVLYEVDGAVALITLNRPRYHNAQSWKMLDALDAALDRAMDDRAVKVVVVQGAGDDFSSGHDLGTPEQLADLEARGRGRPPGASFYEAFRHYNLELTHKWRNLSKPTIALVHGYCIFGGWMIAAAMDLVFASPDARFLAGLVEYFSVPYDIQPRKAKELIFESRFLGAEEARELGFVNRIYPQADLKRETLAYAHRGGGKTEPRCFGCRNWPSTRCRTSRVFSSAMEAAFADFLVLTSTGGDGRKEGERRLGPVDLALRFARGERHGLDDS